MATKTIARPSTPSGESASRVTVLTAPSRWPLLLLVVAILLSAGSIVGLLRLQPDARVDLLIDPNASAFKDQALFADAFGADPVVVMARPGPGASLITPDHIVGLSHLEGKLHQAAGVKKVYGPGTLVNTLAISTTTVLLNVCAQEGKSAETSARQQAVAAGKSQAQQDQAGQQAFQQAVSACAQRYAKAFPSLGVPAVNSPTFIQGVLLEPDGQKVRPFWTSSSSDLPELKDLRFTASGSPALTLSVADSVFNALRFLVPLALVAVLIVAMLALGVSTLLTIAVAALGALWTAGVAGFLGLPVTPATLVVLPVVLGLATDYFIQSVNRVMETPGTPKERVSVAARRILPSTGLAAVATAAGMLAFVLSGIPLVRQFGLFMALGVAMAYLANYLVGLPLLLFLARMIPSVLNATNVRAAAGRRIASIATLAPAAAIAIVVVGLAGWAALPAIKIETDPTQLVPAQDSALAQAEQVRKEVGLAGEIDLVVEGRDAASTDAVKWLDEASRRIAAQSGGDLKAVESLPIFLAGFNQGTLPDASRTTLIFDRIPSYFTGAVYDNQRGLALSIFGLTHVTSVERDRSLVSSLRTVGDPPAGLRAFPAGLAVVADAALSELQGDQLKLTLLAIALILLVLLIGYRRVTPAILAVLPTVVAAGAATGLLFVVGSVLNQRSSPITILLGGVVVAFATEFGVLWLARYRSERAGGIDPADAARVASVRVGPAVAASALALAAGFAVLALSSVPMVRDFGLWSAFDLLLATAAVLVLLPPLARRWYA
ncbi:MAG: hypothetical protein E6I68_05480 [Chloroflexi bacterium]|nr:MAG: hypothetical protein E6I68_05480 [Chloroflexota bacterium]